MTTCLTISFSRRTLVHEVVIYLVQNVLCVTASVLLLRCCKPSALNNLYSFKCFARDISPRSYGPSCLYLFGVREKHVPPCHSTSRSQFFEMMRYHGDVRTFN
jgi:hypothetical protein